MASLLVLAVAVHAQIAGPVPLPAAGPVLGLAPAANQFQVQDGFGSVNHGYSFPGQASTTYIDPFGNQVGTYAFYNRDGKEVRVAWTADSRGFRVLSNDLPVAVVETPEVIQAKAAHFAAHNAARLAAVARLASGPVVAPVAGPGPAVVGRKKRQVAGPAPYPYAGATPYDVNPYFGGFPFGSYNPFATPYGVNSFFPQPYNFPAPAIAPPVAAIAQPVPAPFPFAADTFFAASESAAVEKPSAEQPAAEPATETVSRNKRQIGGPAPFPYQGYPYGGNPFFGGFPYGGYNPLATPYSGYNPLATPYGLNPFSPLTPYNVPAVPAPAAPIVGAAIIGARIA